MKKAIPVAVLALAVVVYSCSKQDVQPSKIEILSSKEIKSTDKNLTSGEDTKFTEKDLFLGIFFLEGEITNRIKSLTKLRETLNPGDLKILADRGGKVVAFIEKNQPEFFEKFASALREADHKAILQGIDFAEESLIKMGISNGEASPVIQELSAGKNCHKWIIVNHFLILRKLGIISSNPSNMQAPEVLLEKEILVNDIYEAIKKG